MFGRIAKARSSNDSGFTLIELLVVMIIIGVLAAIAIPVFLSQRAKAQDSAAKTDASTIGKEIATYYVDNTAAPTISQTLAAPRKYQLTPAGVGAVAQDIGRSSSNVAFIDQFYASPTSWCVYVQNTSGDKSKSPGGYKYSAAGGLQEGVCTSAAG